MLTATPEPLPPLGPSVRARCSVTTYVCACLHRVVCCPVEVALIRMQSDGRLPFADRRNYKHAVDALVRIRREEGAATYALGSHQPCRRRAAVPQRRGNAAGAATESIGRTIGARTRLRCRYWRGCTPTVARAMVVSATQLATYDTVRYAADPPTLSLLMHA